ncbi:mitochondrial ribosomal protein subunit L20-domain-containing protein [Dichotomocladium elegans]|nr:mitochondrial ribosomal protein subunit L20-domain-containing protein [Dichotomocladium elegans]
MHSSYIFIRFYATKSKITNLSTTPRVPVTESILEDGSIFVSRHSPVSSKTQAAAAPPLRTPHQKKYNLTEAQIAEMRQLRLEDPATWTRKKLAEKFGCSELFVSIASPAATTTTKAVEQIAPKHDGYRRQLIKQNRERRRALW